MRERGVEAKKVGRTLELFQGTKRGKLAFPALREGGREEKEGVGGGLYTVRKRKGKLGWGLRGWGKGVLWGRKRDHTTLTYEQMMHIERCKRENNRWIRIYIYIVHDADRATKCQKKNAFGGNK